MDGQDLNPDTGQGEFMPAVLAASHSGCARMMAQMSLERVTGQYQLRLSPNCRLSSARL